MATKDAGDAIEAVPVETLPADNGGDLADHLYVRTASGGILPRIDHLTYDDAYAVAQSIGGTVEARGIAYTVVPPAERV